MAPTYSHLLSGIHSTLWNKQKNWAELSVFYFWKNDKNNEERKGKGIVLSNGFSFAFHSLLSSPAASLYFCSALKPLHWVFPKKAKFGSLPFVCHPWMSWRGGLGTEESFGLTLFWSTNTVLDCANEDNLSSDREIWRRVSIQRGQIIQDRIGKYFRAVFCMDFHGRNYHKASRKLKPYRWKWWWALFHSPQPRHTVGNFLTACTQQGPLLPKSSSQDGQFRPLNWSQLEVYLCRINHQPLLWEQKSTWGCVLCGHWHADRELKAPGLWSPVLQQSQPGNMQFWLTT